MSALSDPSQAEQEMDTEGAKKLQGGGYHGDEGRGGEVGLRAAAVVLTVAAAMVAGLDRQTKTVSVGDSDGFHIDLPNATAKFSYLSAMVYFVVANSVASVVAALTLLLTLSRRRGGVLLKAAIDAAMVALVFSGVGSGAAVGLLGYTGNTHLMWNKVCDQFGRFCHVAATSVVLSFAGGVVFLLLVIIGFHKLTRNARIG